MIASTVASVCFSLRSIPCTSAPNTGSGSSLYGRAAASVATAMLRRKARQGQLAGAGRRRGGRAPGASGGDRRRLLSACWAYNPDQPPLLDLACQLFAASRQDPRSSQPKDGSGARGCEWRNVACQLRHKGTIGRQREDCLASLYRRRHVTAALVACLLEGGIAGEPCSDCQRYGLQRQITICLAAKAAEPFEGPPCLSRPWAAS